MRYPEFYEVAFGDQEDGEFTKRDAALNSDLLREACDMVRPVYKDGYFSTGRAWRVRIEDRHTDEDEPHYVLDFGETGHDGRADIYTKRAARLEVGYCDNYSCEFSTIRQAQGSFTVYAGGDFGDYSAELVAIAVARAYVDALQRHFPDYFILVDDRQLMRP